MASEVCHIGVRMEGEDDEAVRHLSFRPDPSLRDILNGSSARVRSGCAGNGACGLCRVRIDAGDGGEPTTAEYLHLGREAVAAGTRLACQITPREDMDVTVLQPARSSAWRTASDDPYRSAYALSPRRVANGGPSLVAAVDLGTTQISVAIADGSSGRRLAARSGPNPQGRAGADVIGRLDAAARSEVSAHWLRRLAIEAIGNGLSEISREVGIALAEVGRVVVVGNSAMLELLTGGHPGALLDPAAWAGPVECRLDDVPALAEAWGVAPAASVDLAQPLGGFVGSDLMAGVVACRLIEDGEPALLIDFGTNSEIALWSGGTLWVTAAAGGPAFEATGVGCGLAAEPGALYRLSRAPDGRWAGEVLEKPPPRGICGSGLVDMLAILRACGEVDERGRIRREPLTIAVGGAEFGISKADIDMLQRAKGAMAAGLEVLCRRAGIRPDEIGRVHVAGSFGEHLDPGSAGRIGLLPQIPEARIHLAGNTALRGALDLVLSDEAQRALARARGRASLINLSMAPEFEELFLEHLYIRPFPARTP